MHNTLNRLQNVFGYFTSVAAAVAAVIALVSLFSMPAPEIGSNALQLRNVQVIRGRPQYYSSKLDELAHIIFDLDIDLSTLFTWNTKQVFLYVTATYPPSTPNAAPSQSIIWDAVLPHPLAPKHDNVYTYPQAKRSSSKSKSKASTSKDKAKLPQKPGILQLAAQRPKYQISDPSGRIAQKTNVTLELNWNIQPWVGALTWVNAQSRASNAAFGTKSRSSWLPTWRAISKSGRTRPFDLPARKDRAEAVKAAGKEGLNLERGGERNRGRPA